MKTVFATLAALLCALIPAGAANIRTTSQISFGNATFDGTTTRTLTLANTDTSNPVGSSTDNTTALGIGQNSITPKSILDVDNNTNSNFGLLVSSNLNVQAATNSHLLDQRFVNLAILNGLFEIELGQLAVANTSNPDVAAYGQMLIDDHTALNDALAAVAGANGFTIPTVLDRGHQRQLARLDKLAGTDRFDRSFLKIASATLKQSVGAFTGENRRSLNSDLQNFTEDALLILQDELAAAKALNKELRSQ